LADLIDKSRQDLATDEDAALVDLEQKLSSAIRRQLISDVPVGAFLSGGIDSSLVVAIAQKLTPRKLKTFTVAFSDSSHDESEFAEAVAGHLGTDHHTLPVTANKLLSAVDDLAKFQDEPFANPSQLPVYLLSKFAREQVTVCLSGDGGDELFAGYNRYTRASQLWNIRARYPDFVARALGLAIGSLPFGAINSASELTRHSKVLRKFVPPAPGLKLQKLATALNSRSEDKMYLYLRSFIDEPLRLVPSAKCDLEIFEQLQLPDCPLDRIERWMYFDTLTYLPDDSLAKVDRAAMATSLETRLPLLDTDVLAFAWKLPLQLKVQNNLTKRCLRKVLENHLPKSLIERPKMGFTVPVSDWLRGPLRDWAYELMFDDGHGLADLIDTGEAMKLWTQHQNGRQDNGLAIWSIVSLSNWLHNQ
jgi:asparagine synthase (glutamine-hydrolysing)